MTANVHRVFVAGAGGVVGRRLTPMLRQRGYEVIGTTRSAAKADELARSGVNPVVLDIFDQRAVAEAMAAARPTVVIHQLTDLSGGFRPEHQRETLTRNARIRTEGTRNLVLAARSVGARRLIAQSIVWMYATGPEPHGEDDALDVAVEGTRGVTVQGVVALERAVLEASPLEGVVLRYGWFYAPAPTTSPPAGPACTSTRRRTRRCWRSSMARRACTTSPSRGLRSRSTRPSARWDGIPAFALDRSGAGGLRLNSAGDWCLKQT
jgi:nucleoside-diphosphate-sugar epimerase